MKKYTPNSPEAVARIIAMFMLVDNDLNLSELDALEWISLYEALGIERKAFITILKDYCDDLSDEVEANGKINLLEPTRVDSLLLDVTDPKKQLATLAVALDICKSDLIINEPEMALLQYMMQRWKITLEHLEESIFALSFN